MPAVVVKLTLQDELRQGMRAAASDIDQFAKRAQSAGEVDMARNIASQAQSVRGFARDMGQATGESNNLTTALTRATGAAQGFASGVASGLGGGGIGRLITAGSLGAAVSATALLVGQSIRMAYEFERASTNAASALSIGSATFAGNLARVRAAAYTGERYGFDTRATTAAVSAYARTSGAGPEEATSAAPLIATYARAYGLDPSVVGGMVGQYTATTGEGFRGGAAGLFGGAEEGGRMGRRLEEFIGAATATMERFAYGNPSAAPMTAGTAAGITARVAGLGGIYQTAAGQQALGGALSSLTQGGDQDVRRAAFMTRAGLSKRDILLGTDTPDTEARLVAQLHKDYGTGIGYIAALTNVLGQSGARTVVGAEDRVRPGQSLRDVLMGGPGHVPRPAQDDTARAISKAAEVMGSDFGRVEQGLAKLGNTMTADGDKLLHGLIDLSDKIDPLRLAMIALTAAVVLQTAATAVGAGGGLLRWLLRGGAGATAAAAGAEAEGAAGTVAATAGGLGAGAIAIGAGALALGALPFALAAQWRAGKPTSDQVARAERIPGSMASPQAHQAAVQQIMERDRLASSLPASTIGTGDISGDVRTPYTGPGPGGGTRQSLIDAIAFEQQRGVKLAFSVLTTGHRFDNLFGGHSYGLAGDITSANGVDVDHDPKTTMQLFRELMRNPMTKGFGVDPWFREVGGGHYYAELRKEWASRNGDPNQLFPDEVGHIHWRVRDSAPPPNVELHNQTAHTVVVTVKPKTTAHPPGPANAGSRIARHPTSGASN